MQMLVLILCFATVKTFRISKQWEQNLKPEGLEIIFNLEIPKPEQYFPLRKTSRLFVEIVPHMQKGKKIIFLNFANETRGLILTTQAWESDGLWS